MRNDLMTLKEVCKETGVTRKIVQTYENYGLVKATTKNKYGYLLYDDAAVKKIKKDKIVSTVWIQIIRNCKAWIHDSRWAGNDS